MVVQLLRSVSIIAISASLAMPAPILAQTQSESSDVEVCPDGSQPVIQEGSEAPVCPSDAETEVEVQTDVEEPASEETQSNDVTVEVEEQPAAEAEIVTEEEAEAVEAESEPLVTEEPATEAATDASEEDATAAIDEAEQGEDLTTEQGADASQEEEPAAEEDSEAQQEAATEAAADASEDSAEAEGGDTATEETAEDPAELQDAVDAAETSEVEGEAAATAQSEASGDAEASEVAQDDTAETTAEANETVQTEAAAAAAASVDDDASDEVNVETVTVDTARSSDEEFATTAAPAEGREGLSNLERFAIGALGVATIATILNQRDEVVVSSDDRLVVRDDMGTYRVLKNDDELLRRPGVEVATREYSDGSTRTVVTRENGERVVTIRAPNGQVLKRTRLLADGREVVLFDDTINAQPVEMSFLQQYRPQDRRIDANDPDALRAALQTLENPTDRSYSLQQIRQIRAVRDLVPEIGLDNVNFETGSAVIRPEEAEGLSQIGAAISATIAENPNEVFLIEGHTDAVGSAAMNLALSDRRAESVALALTEYFDVPPENLVVQGYGESNLKIRTNLAERENRRVAVRQITPLLDAQR